MPAKPKNFTEPTHDELTALLSSVTEYTSPSDRIARAKMWWYAIRNLDVPPEVISTADLSLDEYEQYVASIIKGFVPTPPPTFRLTQILDFVYPKLGKRAKEDHFKKFCKSQNFDYKALKETTFDGLGAVDLKDRIKNWNNPSSRSSGAKIAGDISGMVRYARAHDDEFHEYLEQTHSKKIRDNLALLWMLYREKKSKFNDKPDRDKNDLFGALKSFRERNQKNSKKHFVKKQAARKAKK
jgi:hypothetical protein